MWQLELLNSPYAVPVKQAYFNRQIGVQPENLGRKPMYLVRRLRKVIVIDAAFIPLDYEAGTFFSLASCSATRLLISSLAYCLL